MARGKQTCKILKEIRRQIAEANDIEFATSECRYKGDCAGTCPKCEAEVQYLEQQLRSRQLMGKAVVLAGLSAGMIAFSGCGSSANQTDDSYKLQGEPELVEDTINAGEEHEAPLFEDSIIVKQGEVGDSSEQFSKANSQPKSKSRLPMVGEIIDPNNPDKVYDIVIDVRPSFPGGDTKLLEWISQHLVYPSGAWESQIQGRVIVSFMIKPDGSVGEAKIIRGVHPDLDKEALRVIKGLPRFNPAQLNGKAVESQYVLPLVFKLDEGQSDKIHTIVEEMPEFPGGQAALLNFFAKNLKFPQDVDEVSGKVIIKFYIDTLGCVNAPHIIRGMGPGFDEEAIRVTKLLPPFIPGRMNGEKVNVWMTLPIVFKLPTE